MVKAPDFQQYSCPNMSLAGLYVSASPGFPETSWGYFAVGIPVRCWCFSAVFALWGMCLKAWGELKSRASSNNQPGKDLRN